MGETARRIRILIEIGSAKNGMALNELEKKYPPEQILGIRLKRLTIKNQISFDETTECYYPKGKRMYSLSLAIKSYTKLMRKILY